MTDVPIGTARRDELPRSVQRSVEFTSACPASARAMALDLRAV